MPGSLTPGQSAYALVEPRDSTVGQLWLRRPSLQDVMSFRLPTANGTAGFDRCNAVASALNTILADTTNDADFLTPSFTYAAPPSIWPRGAYAVVFVKNHGSDPDPACNTVFAVCGGHQRANVQECLYSACGLPDAGVQYTRMSKTSFQTDLIYIAQEDLNFYLDTPWDLALYFADQIRGNLLGSDAINRPLSTLYTTGLANYPSDVFFTGAAYLAGEQVCDVVTAFFNGFEVAHTADLTIARGPDRTDLQPNMWVQIINRDRADVPSVVARVTDSGVTGFIEGTTGGIATALKFSDAAEKHNIEIKSP